MPIPKPNKNISASSNIKDKEIITTPSAGKVSNPENGIATAAASAKTNTTSPTSLKNQVLVKTRLNLFLDL